jgi:hypothetical protein
MMEMSMVAEVLCHKCGIRQNYSAKTSIIDAVAKFTYEGKKEKPKLFKKTNDKLVE